MAETEQRGDEHVTSIIVGGPMYDTMVRLGLWNIPRRIAAFWAVTWLPLCVLASVGGWNNLSDFLVDLPAQIRFLIAAPMLILAERVIEPRAAEVTNYFTSSGLVHETDRPRYQAALLSLEHSCDSGLAEALLLVAAYAAGLFWFRREVAEKVAGWVTTTGSNGLRLSACGWWYAFGSIPIYQFLVYRWLWRSAIWFRFLWRVSRMNLRLIPTHPDLAGGLGFLGIGQAAFGAILFPSTAVIAAVEGEKMLHKLETFSSIQFALLGIVAALSLLFVLPMLFFTGPLLKAKRKAQLDYGLLGQRYVDAFDERWIREQGRGRELLGVGDIQSLADIQNAFGCLMRMRLAPIDRTTLISLVLATGLPFVPLALTEMPIDQILKKLVGILI